MHLRLILVLGATLLSGLAIFLLQRDAAPDIHLLNVSAVPVVGEPDAVRIFMSVDNDGPPDALVSVASPEAQTGQLYSPVGAASLPLPAGSSPSLATDGAHLILSGLSAPAAEGQLIPITVGFASGATLRTKARFAAPVEAGAAAHDDHDALFGIGDICQVGEGEPVPRLSLSVTGSQEEGYTVTIATQNLTMTEPVEGMGHMPGYGHGHLYLDGVKLQRLYTTTARIGALPPGEHLIRVTLNSNDHRAYVTDGQPITAEVALSTP